MVRAYAAGLSHHGVATWMLCGLAASASAWGSDSAPVPRAAGAQPVSPAAQPSGQLLDFDIPAQSLAAALDRYASLSGWPILFHGTMVAGRTSAAVRGRYRPEAALLQLLDGTGLTPEKVSGGPADAYVLKEAQAIVAGAGEPAVDFDYGGWVQARFWQALCADSRTAPGSYRSLLRFRVATNGRVHAVRMISSTGDARRDHAVLEILRNVHVDRSPPPGMAQPLTMLVLPFDQAGGPRCVNAGFDSGTGGAS